MVIILQYTTNIGLTPNKGINIFVKIHNITIKTELIILATQTNINEKNHLSLF